MTSSPKVSVVIPTYCSGERINDVVRSLDSQKLPKAEFEVLFIDDGSADDTVSVLNRIASARPNVRVFELEHSGWPSTSRNYGIEKARGEYILFMDHDDELYPDSLSQGYAFASRNSADVLNGKEARTDQPKWALDTYIADFDNAIGRTDVHPLVPTNPHKLYRRQFLLDNRIRFPEGSRVLWEDVFFNLDVAKNAKIISTMTSTPFYHWVQHGNNTSRSFTQDLRDYWTGLRRIFEATATCLAGPSLAQQKTLMLAYQYSTRLLPALGPSLWENDKSDIEFALVTARDLINEYLPETFDDDLSAYGKARAHLIRAGDFSSLKKLVRVDPGMYGLAVCNDAAWHNGELEIRSTATWRTSAGRPLALKLTDDGRILRSLPLELAEALGVDLLDVTDDVYAACTTIGIKSRASKITWLIPTTHRVEVLGSHGGRAEVTVRSTATLNIDDAAFGAPLKAGIWDFNAKNELFGVVNHRGLRSEKVVTPAVIHGRALEAYVNKNGMLSLDMDQRIRTIARPNRNRAVQAKFSGWKELNVRIPLKKLTLRRTRLACSLQLGDQATVPAVIENRGRGNCLYATIASTPGRYSIKVGSTTQNLHETGAQLVIHKFGRAELQ
ncbi:glycosyltransferase family 2 protein [Paramicrobacterium chengjingii]|uniref:Glycosyltransferase n=1 Tax=Paramicrobacterium chengjingii TaxID=2769067 RepID=A0ABX6YLC7_9MICO|nr:glycosyltransferase family 2 protein [Microbacterium chengjingii]QPZ39409.1 glycosyltransferase [Microbacterium chengjingii]